MSQVGLFRHLQQDFSSEQLGMAENVTEFGPHELVWVVGGIGVGLYPAPGRTDNECISAEGLYLQEVLVDVLEDVGRFLVDAEVMPEHG